MNIPKEIIEKAIEGGWKRWEYLGESYGLASQDFNRDFYEILSENKNDQCLISLDPTFWQALGKALGWKEAHDPTRNDYTWVGHAHRFYDLILTNQDTKEFWAALTNNNSTQ